MPAPPAGAVIEAVAASVLVAYRGLRDHVGEVARGLDTGLAEARAAVAHLVGRDPASLDGPGVARAAVESLAENFADGVVAPLFWYVLLGFPGLLAYKAINTLDSMIGHRDPRYRHFGRVAARVDDAASWIPSRLAAALLAGAALVVPGASARGALRTAFRDARHHRSVNAGWPEAAMAGALGFAIAGPRRYGGRTVEDAWMDGRRTARALASTLPDRSSGPRRAAARTSRLRTKGRRRHGNALLAAALLVPSPRTHGRRGSHAS